MHTILIIAATALPSVLFLSLFEWFLHRNVMHRPFLGSTYAFIAHDRIHHQTFKSDDSYHLKDENDRRTITMAWWNGAVLTLITTLPSLLFWGFADRWTIILTVYATSWLYYGAYEYFHLCMHLPKPPPLFPLWLFRFINGHHVLHHQYKGRNLNVVLPFADFVLGTFMPRSPANFRQATGPTVPDLQPKKKR